MGINDILISLIGGFVAGSINTLAGFGSIITLSIYTELFGLPLVVANGTNRVNLFAQTSIASFVFYQNGKLNLKQNWLYVSIIFVFAMVGVYLATNTSNEQFKIVFKYLLLVFLPIIIINPKRWLIKTKVDYQPPKLLLIILSILLGLYGGFIQMGMGIFFLGVFVFIAKINIIESNALKVTIVSLYTIVLIIIFHYKGLIDWPLGLLLAIGQGLGAWITSKYASTSPYADKIAYGLLVFVLLFSIYRYWL